MALAQRHAIRVEMPCAALVRGCEYRIRRPVAPPASAAGCPEHYPPGIAPHHVTNLVCTPEQGARQPLRQGWYRYIVLAVQQAVQRQ